MLETVRIPGNQRVVGLKPGFNSKTIQTNAAPPQPHPYSSLEFSR